MPTYLKARLIPATRSKPARVSIIHLNSDVRSIQPLSHRSVREQVEALFPGCEFLLADYGWLYFRCRD